MNFITAFKKVINMVDPVANSSMTAENTQIKILADWSRKAATELEKHRWIPVAERLPEDGQRVFVKIKDPNPDEFDAAKFEMGKIPKKGETICHADQWGNNHKPYCWNNYPMSYFGQRITHWKPIILPEESEV